MYQSATPVSKVIEGSTTHLTNNPDITVTMLPNEFSTVVTTFDVNDKTTTSYPVVNKSESVAAQFANDGKYILYF